MKIGFAGRLGLQQRVLPSYRVPFLELLAGACDGGLSVFAGQPRPAEGIRSGDVRIARHAEAGNVHLLGGPLYLCYQRGLTRWLEDWDPQALVLEANPRYLATGSAVGWMHARGRHAIGWGLGAPALTGPLKMFRNARRRDFLLAFDALIAYSQRGAREYEALGFPRERVFVAMNSASMPPANSPLRRRSSSGAATVLFVGRLQRRKRVDFLVRACAQMPEPRPRLVIVGDGPERHKLELVARRLYPSVEFVGAKHGEELKPYFLDADLFVLPGTGGLAVQEAMANGLPVIVAKGDGTQDDLVKEENGWQIPAGDFAALLTSLRSALADLPRLGSMGANSYRIVSNEINPERMVESFLAALYSVR
jgi:glycosyltransferase involved in cell wall biosynthesis